MGKGWASWLAFLVLAATISVTSCQAFFGPAEAAAPGIAAP